MSYICQFCGVRPENCACSIDLLEPRLESELVVADNIMAVENPSIQRPYGLLDAPSPADFFSLLVEMEKLEHTGSGPKKSFDELLPFPIPRLERQSNPLPEVLLTLEEMERLEDYELTPTSNSSFDELLSIPIPRLERQTNRPPELCLTEADLNDLKIELFPEEALIPDADFSEYGIRYPVYCETCSEFSCGCGDQLAREAYETDRECGTYEYDRFCRDFPEEVQELIKCPTCEKMIYTDEQYGMCYACHMAEQRLYPDDIPMDLRYNSDRDSF